VVKYRIMMKLLGSTGGGGEGELQETGKEMNTEELRDLYLINCLELTTFGAW
jgi:hypothetical protein